MLKLVKKDFGTFHKIASLFKQVEVTPSLKQKAAIISNYYKTSKLEEKSNM